MRHLILLLVLVSLHSSSFAHKSYFGFAEVEYNYFTQRFEATVSVTGHDLQLALEKSGQDAGDLTSLTEDQTEIIEAYMNEQFSISSGANYCSFKVIGHESLLTGTVNFYLESTEIQVEKSIDVAFNVLMEHYEFQQNKMTLYYSERAYTLEFTLGTVKQTIQLENSTK